MPTVGASPADTVWQEGFMFGKLPGGATYDVPFGALQDISLKFAASLKKLMGNGSYVPIATRMSEKSLTGTAKWAKLRLRGLTLLMGGTIAYSTATKFTAKTSDELPAFDLQLKGPADGSEITLNVYNCLAPDVTIPLTSKDFAVPDFSFESMGKASTGELFELTLPGDQTTS